MKRINTKVQGKLRKKCLVYKYNKKNIQLLDYRMLPPRIVSPTDAPDVELIQRDVDEVSIGKERSVSFFTPSLVSIQLNVAKPAILRCGELKNKVLCLAKEETLGEKSNDKFIEDSLLVYDYVESAQAAIIFSFTAIETFFNLSIPDEYEFRRDTKRSSEIFNKEQIERNVSWKDKLKIIIPEIYQIEDISAEPFWDNLHQLIQIRNDIIHQKSSDDTEVIQRLINLKIPTLCFSAIELIKHVYESAATNNSLPACCEKFPIVSSDSKIWLIKSVKNLEPIYGGQT